MSTFLHSLVLPAHPSTVRTHVDAVRPWALAALLSLLFWNASSVQAQVVRCTDARTGQVTYTNGACIQGEAAVQVQKAQSAEDIARERAQAQAAQVANQEQWARDNQARDARLEREHKEDEAWQRAQSRNNASNARPASAENTACQQARTRYNGLLAQQSSGSLDDQERSQQALHDMEMACLGYPATAQGALRPNAINRPWRHPSSFGPYPGASTDPVPSTPPASSTGKARFSTTQQSGGSSGSAPSMRNSTSTRSSGSSGGSSQ